jgi:hypothetical protein
VTRGFETPGLELAHLQEGGAGLSPSAAEQPVEPAPRKGGGPRGNYGFLRASQRAKLEDGDRLTVGTSELLFSLGRP